MELETCGHEEEHDHRGVKRVEVCMPVPRTVIEHLFAWDMARGSEFVGNGMEVRVRSAEMHSQSPHRNVQKPCGRIKQNTASP